MSGGKDTDPNNYKALYQELCRDKAELASQIRFLQHDVDAKQCQLDQACSKLTEKTAEVHKFSIQLEVYKQIFEGILSKILRTY